MILPKKFCQNTHKTIVILAIILIFLDQIISIMCPSALYSDMFH